MFSFTLKIICFGTQFCFSLSEIETGALNVSSLILLLSVCSLGSGNESKERTQESGGNLAYM